jgi:predicted acylesterase/phospholipase RssA
MEDKNQSETIKLTIEEQVYYNRLRDLSFNNLSLSSGGMNGLIILGALNFLHNINKLDNIKNYIGCSIGSLLSLLLVIGLIPFEINQLVIDIKNEKDFSHFDIQNLLSNFGVYSHNKLKDIISSMIMTKLDFIPTMKELYEITEKTFTCVVFNYTKYNIEYATHLTHPNVSCVDIVSASCCIPLIFDPVKINEDLYIDGGVLDPFPINYCKKTFQGNTLGLVLLYQEQDHTLLKYIDKLVFLNTTINKHKQFKKNIKEENICIINLENDNKTLKFNMDMTEKLKMFAKGDVQVRKKFKLLDKLK